MSEQSKSIIIASMQSQGMEKDALQALGFQVISEEKDGESALKSILEYHPDVVLCDVFLPGMDALGILEVLRVKAPRTIVICVSSSPNDALASRLMQNGAKYFLVRPYGLEYLAKRIDAFIEERDTHKSISAYNNAPQINDEYDLESCISDMMRQIGIPAHIRGYKYIRKSIQLALENGELLNAITKELYPTIARIYKTTPSRVERAIRHAIEVAWQRGDIEVLTTLFGYTIKTSKGKPTNGEFISMLTDRLRLNLRFN